MNKASQQFLQTHLSKQPDKARLQNLKPVQLRENCFQKKTTEPFESRQSPPQQHGIKPSPKPQQSNHKSNNSLRMESLQDKLQGIKKRDCSPNSDAIRLLLKSSQQKSDEISNLLTRRPQSIIHEHPITFTPTPKYPPPKSYSPMEIKESVAQLLHFKTDVSSPKNNSNQKQKNCHVGPYLSVQSQLKQQKHHSSGNSISQIQPTHTPKKFTTTSQNTEHSKSKSVVEEQLQCMKMIDKENNSSLLNTIIDSTQVNSQRTCLYHRDKKAKYVSEDGSDFKFFCSKCAVKLASQGMQFTEIAQLKQSSEMSSTISPQMLSFQQSSIESSHRQSIDIKEKELKVFLALLNQIQQNFIELRESLSTQGIKLNYYYDAQIKQCRDTKQKLILFLEEISTRAIKEIENSKLSNINFLQSLYVNLEQQQHDTQSMKTDIQANWTSVLSNIDLDSFRNIMNNYQNRFSSIGEFQQNIYNQYINITQIGSMDVEGIMAVIASNYEIVETAIPLINSTFNQPIRTQPTPPKKRDVSSSQRVKTDLSSQKRKVDNFCQYFNTQGTQLIPPTKFTQQSIHNNSNNLYISFENKDMFMNALEAEKKQNSDDDNASKQQAIMILQSYRGSHADIEEDPLNESKESAKSTPQSPASVQTKEAAPRLNQSEQIIVNQDNQVPSIAFQKQKPTQNAFRTLFENDDLHKQEQQQDTISPAKSDKFKSILNRISNSQSKTQQFYQQMLQSQSKQDVSDTPQLKCENQREIQEEVKDSVQQINLCDDQQDLSDYEGEDTQQPRKYQKTLFQSPMFKDI